MKLPRRNFLHLAAGTAALPTASRFAWAQAYPSRPVHLIAPFAPGGAFAWRSTLFSCPIAPNWVRSSSGCGTDDCGRTSATSRPSTMPSPLSIRPSGSAGRRSSAFVREDLGTASGSALLLDHRRLFWIGRSSRPSLPCPGSPCSPMTRRAPLRIAAAPQGESVP